MIGKIQFSDAGSADRVIWIVMSISVALLPLQYFADDPTSGAIAMTGAICGVISILTGDLSRRCSYRAFAMYYGMIMMLLHQLFVH